MATVLQAETTQATPYKWSVEQYERMIEAGVLTKDDHVELIKGEIVKMASLGLRHESCVRRLTHLLGKIVGDTAIVSVQMSVRLPRDSQPEPDVALLRWRDDYYLGKRAEPEDMLLLIEVADSTLATDRKKKVPLYAEAGVSEVWLVDVEKGVVEVYTNPAQSAYQNRREAKRGETLLLPGVPDSAITVDEILG